MSESYYMTYLPRGASSIAPHILHVCQVIVKQPRSSRKASAPRSTPGAGYPACRSGCRHPAATPHIGYRSRSRCRAVHMEGHWFQGRPFHPK